MDRKPAGILGEWFRTSSIKMKNEHSLLQKGRESTMREISTMSNNFRNSELFGEA